jgi:hypothetical protein
MTDRVKGLTVTFGKDIRIDDIDNIVNAIKMIKGVIDVTPEIVDTNDHMARMVIKNEVRQKFYDFLQKEL